MKHIQELVELLVGRLETISQSDAVVGTAIKLGNITIVPLSRISIGMGAGGGTGEGHHPGGPRARQMAGKGKGTGGGTGGGATVRPAAIAVFTEEGVEIMPIPDQPGWLEKLLEKVPDLVSKITEAAQAAKPAGITQGCIG